MPGCMGSTKGIDKNANTLTESKSKIHETKFMHVPILYIKREPRFW